MAVMVCTRSRRDVPRAACRTSMGNEAPVGRGVLSQTSRHRSFVGRTFSHRGSQLGVGLPVVWWRCHRGYLGDRRVSRAALDRPIPAQAPGSPDSPDGDDNCDAPRVVLAVDGKRVRGAVDGDGNAPHLLAAATHGQALVLAQVDVHHKTHEIPMFAPLLDSIDITGMLITADCLHTQRAHARYLHSRNADFVFCVKDNQPGLFAAL